MRAAGWLGVPSAPSNRPRPASAPVRVSAALVPSMCVPPSMVLMLFTKPMMVSLQACDQQASGVRWGGQGEARGGEGRRAGWRRQHLKASLHHCMAISTV